MTRLYHQFLEFLAEQREEHISPEDREARNKAIAREKAENQHTQKVREIRNSFENAGQRRHGGGHERGPDDSRNMNHDIISHKNGKVHIRTDLNTGRTEVTHEKDTLAQKKARHDAEVKKQRAGMGSHIVDRDDNEFFGHFKTTITPINKDGTPNHGKAKVVKTDHVTGETVVHDRY